MQPCSAQWLCSFLYLSRFISNILAQGSYGGSQTTCSDTQAWISKGCYGDTENGRHVNFNWQLSSDPQSPQYYPGYSGLVTVDFCQKACRGHGFRYAALYYGSECYCASTFPNPDPPSTGITSGGSGTPKGTNPGVAVAPTNCDSKCAGNPTQFCGSGSASNVYEDPSYTYSAASQSASKYLYMGCFSNINPGVSYTTIRTTDTPSCQNYCSKLGYPYSSRSGVDSDTGSFNCGCGTEVQSGYQIDESRCSFRCDGSGGAA